MTGLHQNDGPDRANTARAESTLRAITAPPYSAGRFESGHGLAPLPVSRWVVAAAATATVALPLVGAAWAGRDLRQLLRFPPSPESPTNYPRFSWMAAAGVAGCVAALAAPWALRLIRRGRTEQVASATPPARSGPARRFPVWGTVALAWTATWWVLAWTRFGWFATWQRFTFFPLWLGFVVTVNAATVRRTGSCLMLRRPGAWLALFLASAVAWWGFEWLNRFVENWHYLGVQDFGPGGYALHASVCFSTVLPAVAAVAEWLHGATAWRQFTLDGPRWRVLTDRRMALALVVASLAALVGTGASPLWTYPALWAAPVGLVLALPALTGRAGYADEPARGDWRAMASWMIAALICGGFWEMWNAPSAAKWIYTVPGVDRWHIFEMPLLGYSGYLAFGVECRALTEAVVGRAWVSPHAR